MSYCMRATKGNDVCRKWTGSIANYWFPCHWHDGQPIAAMDLSPWAPNWREIEQISRNGPPLGAPLAPPPSADEWSEALAEALR